MRPLKIPDSETEKISTKVYAGLISQEFAKRSQQNPKYSLRAFARDLTLDPAQLSRILRYQKNLSPALAQTVAPRLFPKDRRRQDYFVKLVEWGTAKRPEAKKQIEAYLNKKSSLSFPVPLELDKFQYISNWYSVAILEFCSLPGITPTAAVLAERLGLQTFQVENSFSLLERLGLIQKTAKLGFKKITSRIHTPTEVPNSYIRQFHNQMIHRGLEALENQPITERNFVARTLTIKKSDLPKIKSMVDDFCEDLYNLVSQNSPHDSVYQFNFQIFNLEKTSRKTKNPKENSNV